MRTIESTTGETLELASALRLAVMRLARRLRQQAEADVTPSMLSALSTIERAGPIALSELAAAERVRPPTITAVVARLESAELVTRENDPEDRRISRLSLSAKGRRLIEATRSRKNAYLAKRLSTLTPEDRATLDRAALVLERLLEDDR